MQKSAWLKRSKRRYSSAAFRFVQTSQKHSSFGTWGNICLSSFLIIFNAQIKPSSEDFAFFRVCFSSGFQSSKISLWILGNCQSLDLNIFAAAAQQLGDIYEQCTTSNCSQISALSFCQKRVRITSEILKKEGCLAKRGFFYVTYECPVANSNCDRH